MMSVQLLLGDCLEVMRTLPDGCVDAIITDLPYGTTACKWDEVIPFAPMWEQVKRLLKPRGAFVTTASQPFTSKLVMSNLDWFRYEWIWDKVYSTGHLNAKKRPMSQHETILVFGEVSRHDYFPQMEILEYGDPRYRLNGRKGPGHRDGGVYGEYAAHHHDDTGTRHPKSILRFAKSRRSDCDHPTQKPVALYEYLIRTYTNEGDTVLDFTMGSGTTGVAAANTNRNFIGCDNDAGYFAIAQRRIAQAQMQLPLLERS